MLKKSTNNSSISKQIPENYQENLISSSTKWISAIIITLLIGGIIIFNLRKEGDDYNKSDETDATSSVSNSLNEENDNSLNLNDKEIVVEKNNSSSEKESSSESNTSNNNSSSAQQNQSVVETKTITETIYIEDADDVSFNYDSSTVKVKDGQIRCIDDDRILQWHEGEKEWECKKALSVVFGDLDKNSVDVNSSGQLECENDGDFLYWDGGDDQWACGDVSGMSSITAGDGLSETSGEISINAPTCSGTDKLQWNGSAFICSSDINTDTNTDSQTLSFNSSTGEITISSGNTVDLSALSTGTTDHNDLNNIQGGTTDQYYHLNSAQYGDLTDFLGVLSFPDTDGTNGQILQTNGSGTLSWTTNASGISDHTLLSNIGTNTHAQLDTHIANVTTNPHSVDSSDVGLGNVDNTSDLNKPISTATQNALDLKADITQLHDSVTLAGKDYLTLSGQEITANQIDLTDDVTGILPIANGGTGSTTQNFVDLTNPQTVAGIKTFSSFSITPSSAPTTDYQVANKKYVDDNAGGTSTFLGLTDTLSSFTAGSILFTSASAVTEDNTNFFYDDTADSLGIGTNSVTAKTHIKGATSDDTAHALKVDDSANANLFSVKNDGLISFKNYFFPTTDGSANQVLKTNGSGALTWQDDSGAGAVDYSNVNLDASRQVGSPTTVTTLDKAYDYIWSAGLYSGFELTDNGDGTVNIAAGEGVLRSSASPTAPLNLITVAGVNNLALTDNSANYIYVDYNAGSPIITVGTSVTDFNCLEKCILYQASREGNEISYINAMSNNVDANRSYRRKDFEIGSIDIGSGAKISETGTRSLGITAGSFWSILSNLTTPAFDTSGTDTFDLYYRNGVGGWTKSAGLSQVENVNWDDGTGTLNTLANNQFGTRFVFMSVSEVGSHPVVVMGQEEHSTDEAAANEQVPGDLPPEIDAVGSILAVVIVQENVANFTSILNASETNFSASLPTTHNNLSGLQGGTTNEYYHLTSAQTTNLTGFSNAVTLPSADGTINQVLQTNGSGTVSWATVGAGSTTFLGLTDTIGSFTAGSILFTSGSAVTEDNTNFFWDDATDSLGIGTNSVTAKAHIKGATSDDTAYALKVDDSSNANLFSVRNDGLITFGGNFVLDGGMYKDWNYPITTLASGGGTNPDIVSLASTNIEIAAFDGGTTTEEVSGVLEIDHDYKEGTDIIPHIHWLPTDASAGNVVWQLEYTILTEGDIASTATTINVIDGTNSTAWEQLRISFPTISGTGLTIGDQIFFRLYRDPTNGSDTYGVDAAAATVGFHYQANSLGSTTETTK